MTTDSPSSSNTIRLTADGRTDTFDEKIFVPSLILIPVGIFLLVKGGLIGCFSLGLGILGLIGSFVGAITVTTFDFAQRRITVAKLRLSRTTIRRTLPFDAVRALDIKPGGGAALWLQDGTILDVTDAPSDYTQLDRRLADIRARLGIAATHPAAPLTDSGRDVTCGPNGAAVIAAPRWSVLKHRLRALHTFFIAWVMSMPVLYFQPSSPSGSKWAALLLSAIFLSLSLCLIVMGFRTLFGRLPRLLLDPTTRQADLHWEWPSIWPRETIAFDDFIAAGVWESSDRKDRTVLPYIRLLPNREIKLWYFSDSFLAARDIALRICQLTGAELRNVNAMEVLVQEMRAADGQHHSPSSSE